jgi:hypothetical protein
VLVSTHRQGEADTHQSRAPGGLHTLHSFHTE